MAKTGYAQRYSQAMFQIALEKGDLDKWQSDLNRIARLGEDITLREMLENPRLHFNDKSRLLSEQLGGTNPLVLNLLYLLLLRGRLGMIGAIADGFQQMLDNYRGIERAEVTTATPLDEEDKLRLEASLGKIVNKQVVIEPKVDASLLGGIVARVGGKLLDGSTRSRLEALKRDLAGTER
ncbi:MAG: ATP synthase F1 subunit delta [Dehalococcoidales bacterium]|nr:ATP synthase F1 subunit delta [Dehalococcoidales bacterium]